MEQVSLKIDGKGVSCPPGISILNAALECGIKIPTLCHHPHLEPFGSCRLCIVEDEKSGRIVASCVTPVSPEMSIRTDSPILKRHRKNIIRLMMANHPESCIVCGKGNRCELRKIAAGLGIGLIDLYPMPHFTGLEEANPFIIRDLSKCILCGKCIRADHELVAVGAIDFNLRGFKSRPAAVHDLPLEKSQCTFCGTCVSMCPTGALMIKNKRYIGTPQIEKSTICGFCGVGCRLVTGSFDGQIVDVNPSHEKGTVNRSTLCVRGHFAHDFLNVPERLKTPLIRKDGELSPATWEEAIDLIAHKLPEIKKRCGPQSMAFFGSSKCSVEENYLFQKIARVLFGTNNIDNGSYLSGRSIQKRIHERLGGGGRINPLIWLEKAEAIFILGANPSHSLPVLGYTLKRASRMKRVPIILADPRRSELVPFASIWLSLNPHSDSEMIHGLAAALYRRKSIDQPFIQNYTEGQNQYFESLSALPFEEVERITGIDREMTEQAAELLSGKKVAFVIGHGILQQKNGRQAMDALLNLALMTGSLGKEGAGFYVLASENNEAGAWDMGTLPDFLPGRESLLKTENRKYWERAWQVPLSPDPGLNIIQMIEEIEEGNVKALFIMGENPLRSLPQPGQIRKAFDRLEFLVVQDILHNETTRLADVVLPGAAFSEKDGSFTNMEGRIQHFDPAVSPPGEARPDWDILDRLGNRMGFPEPYKSIQRIRDEIGGLVPMYSELGRNGSHSWIQETSRLSLFHPEGENELIHFSPFEPIEDEPPDEDYPFKAILGSLRCHLGCGTRTGYSERIRDFDLRGEVEITSEDAANLGVQDGGIIRISSPYGTIEREVKISKNLKSGLIFIPKAFNENDSRNILALTTLESLRSPGFKEINVKVTKR